MTTSPDYEAATNTAYKVLAECENFSFPIYVNKIIKRYPDIKVISYSEAGSKYGLCFDTLTESSDHGFTLISDGRRIIFYNEKKDKEIIRFTMAHELGHYLLEHALDDDVSRREANCFARNLLCPIPVVRELKLECEGDYMKAFAVSEPMATVSVNLADYDFDLIDASLYSQMQDLLMCYMTGCTLDELYGYAPERDTYMATAHANQSAVIYARDKANYVTDEEKELLDRLKFGE